MKLFRCDCGQRVFFDNTTCLRCGSQLGFDPGSLAMISLSPATGGEFADSAGAAYRRCRNYAEHRICNWLVRAEAPRGYCIGCDRTKVIPSLGVPGNLELWSKLETAKRRLLYTLLYLGLPLTIGGTRQLRFRFMEDRRRNPAVLESFVGTGHAKGTVTINVAEADDAERHAVREQMQERYRTLLGHFRHESGHFYFGALVRDHDEHEAFRALFGDERADYEEAIAAYYRDGAPTDWSARYVSAYAAAHPHEDWAETFAHYLHIVDALETAEATGLATPPEGHAPRWIREWMELSVTLNELNRSLGQDDPYPFVLTTAVQDKLSFIDRLVRLPTV